MKLYDRIIDRIIENKDSLLDIGCLLQGKDDLQFLRKKGGVNSFVYFFKSRKDRKKFCVKVSSPKSYLTSLKIEARILKVLWMNGLSVPRITASGSLSPEVEFSILEALPGRHRRDIDKESISHIVKLIIKHQEVINNHIDWILPFPASRTLYAPINYKLKISSAAQQHTPYKIKRVLLGKLDCLLNSKSVISCRTIATDRSVSNLIWKQKKNAFLIDFSTTRVGSPADSLYQFLDDPQLNLSMEDTAMFTQGIIQSTPYVVASRGLTSLLQAIYLYQSNPLLSNKYYKKALNILEEI